MQVWRLVRKHDPQPYNESVLGFMEPRLRMLSRVRIVFSIFCEERTGNEDGDRIILYLTSSIPTKIGIRII